MSDKQMPVAEATQDLVHEDERNAYELAFHVLPTVAEGEVEGVYGEIKALITKLGGEITLEEAPQRFELAYEIEKHLEGKNRKFTSAYFGWVRFLSESSVIETLTEEIDHRTDILRHLLLKLSKIEEETPFYFHDALDADKDEVVEEKEDKDKDEEGEESEEKTDDEEATEEKA